MSTAIVDGGFADPVFASQRAFRAIMDAFARPGSVADLAGLSTAPAPLSPAAAAILLTLADGDTPVFFEDGHNLSAVTGWVGFHTGAPVATDPYAARFAVLCAQSDCAGWKDFAIGTSTYPDRSATLLLPVDGLEGGQGLTLSGPGIETVARISPNGLPAGFLDVMNANRAGFPLGFDLVLVCDGQAIALPRTTRISKV